MLAPPILFKVPSRQEFGGQEKKNIQTMDIID
jgi:hypothetical protein